jgi:hypothetical protein
MPFFNVVPSSPILVTMMTEALSSSETSILTKATQRNITEDAIQHICVSVHTQVSGWSLIRTQYNLRIMIIIFFFLSGLLQYDTMWSVRQVPAFIHSMYYIPFALPSSLFVLKMETTGS